MDLLKLFNEAKKSVEKNVQLEEEFKNRNFVDERFIEFPKGNNTYKFKLVFAVQEGSKRVVPFIFQQCHRFWDEDEKELHKVICPTSEYLDYLNGFKKCPICEEVSKLYKDWKNNDSKIAEELYRTFKRQFNGYAMVYVINDPVNPDNNGKFKIMRFGWTIYNFLKRDIFGIINSQDENAEGMDPDDIIGVEAFDLEEGYELIVSTTIKNDYNEYSCRWSKKKSKAPFTEEEAQAAVEELKFDEDFYVKSTKEELQEFYNKFLCGAKNVDVIENKKSKEVKDKEIDDEIFNASEDEIDLDSDSKIPIGDSTETDKKIEEDSTDIEDIDVDALFED